jgi:hypothetical protein
MRTQARHHGDEQCETEKPPAVTCDHLAPPAGKTGVSRTSRMNYRRFVRSRAMTGVGGPKFYLLIRPGAGEARGAGGISCRGLAKTKSLHKCMNSYTIVPDILKMVPVCCLAIAIAHDKEAPLRRVVCLARPVAPDHRRRNVGGATKHRFVIVAGVAVKQRLAISDRPYPRDQAATIGTGDGSKRRCPDPQKLGQLIC